MNRRPDENDDIDARKRWKPSENLLYGRGGISSSKTITVWDLETKTKFRSLTGHSNDILKMIFLPQNNMFVSAALNDRIINAW